MDAQKFDRIVSSIIRNPGHADWQIAKNLGGISSDDVAAARQMMAGEIGPETGASE